MSYSGKFKDKNNNLHPVTSVLYGTCDTAAATAAKVVTCTDFDALMTGVTIRVKFANANTAASPTVNINSTGAKSVYRFGSTAPVDGNSWNAGEVVELVYDGTSFFMTGADDIAAKQNATDNSLETTDKTIVGAINEHEGDISTLKSGLTDLDNEVNGDAVEYPYADVITIEDAVPANVADCSVKIEPVQDLHGQSAPYVGGAGKNLLETPDLNTTHGDVSIVSNKDDAGNVLSITFTGTTSVSANNRVLKNGLVLPAGTYKVTNKLLAGTAAANKPLLVVDIPNATSIRVTPNQTADLTLSEETTLGNIYYNFGDDAGLTTNYTAQAMICSASASEPTVFAPWSNICPITGHTEASVQRDGVNLFNPLRACTISNYWNDNILTKPNANVVINADGSFTSSETGHWCIYSKFYFKKNKTYYLSTNCIKDNNPNTYLGVCDSTGKNVKLAYHGTGITLDYDLDGYYVVYYEANWTTGTFKNMVTLEQADIADYVPYAGKTYTIVFKDGQGNTVTLYGAEGNVNTGAFTVKKQIVDISTLSFQLSADNRWITTAEYGFKHVANDVVTESITDSFKAFSANDLYNDTTAIGFSINNNGNFAIRNGSTVDTPTGDLCYDLATPISLQLDPTKIQLLQGTNIIFCSTGDISVAVNGVAGAIGELTEAMTPYKQFSFDGTPDANGMIVTTCPLADYIPMTVFNPARDGWYYEFVKYTAVSSTYWLVKVFNANTESGVFGGKILAIKNTVV